MSNYAHDRCRRKLRLLWTRKSRSFWTHCRSPLCDATTATCHNRRYHNWTPEYRRRRPTSPTTTDDATNSIVPRRPRRTGPANTATELLNAAHTVRSALLSRCSRQTCRSRVVRSSSSLSGAFTPPNSTIQYKSQYTKIHKHGSTRHRRRKYKSIDLF